MTAARLSAAAVLTVLCGCWGGQFVDMPGRVERMEAGQERVETTLDSMRTVMGAHESLLRGLQAQSGSRATELVEQMAELTAEMESLLGRMGSGGSYAAPRDSTSRSEQLAFDEAYLQYQQRSYTTAAEGFLSILAEGPGGALADDALYYAALCHEGLSLAHKAIEELVALSIMFPDSERAPAALSRAAAIYGAHGAASDRERLLEMIIEEYPDSEEARLAEAALQK